MRYDSPASYNFERVSYSGKIELKPNSLIAQFVLSNVIIFYNSNQDLSNFTSTTIEVDRLALGEISAEFNSIRKEGIFEVGVKSTYSFNGTNIVSFEKLEENPEALIGFSGSVSYNNRRNCYRKIVDYYYFKI